MSRRMYHPLTFGRSLRGAASLCCITSACAVGRAALADLPAGRGGRPTAVFVLRSEQCDANVSMLDVFERQAIRGGITLVGVVLLDGDTAAGRVNSQLRAFDVPVGVLRVSRATRDSLGAIVRDAGPAVVVLDPRRAAALVLPAPRSPGEAQRVAGRLAALAASRAQQP